MNIILGILLLHFIFFNYKSTVLYCGLFGWSGDHPTKFNRHIFTMLGLSNEERGTDSCGIFSNREAIFGTGGNSKFSELMKEIKPIKVGKDCVVLGHTRKASVGVANIDNAQPIILGNEDEEVPEIILTHNGTLYNAEVLGKKYKIDVSALDTDSQMLASLMAQLENPFTILEEYIGTAALAGYFPKRDTFFLFKGHSPNVVDGTFESEERPLYYYQDSKNNLYYSSIKAILEIAAVSKDSVEEVPDNTVLIIHKGQIVEKIEINRKKAGQRAAYTAPAKSYPNYGRSSDFWKKHYGYGNDEYDYYGGRGARSYNSSPNVLPGNRNPGTLFSYNTPCSITDSIVGVNINVQNFLTYKKGRYMLENKPAHGIYYVNSRGYVKESKVKGVLPIAFIDGIMLESVKDFKGVHKIFVDSGKNLFNTVVFSHVLKHSALPVANTRFAGPPDAILYSWDKTVKGRDEFTGAFRPYFTTFRFQCEDGLIKKASTDYTYKEYNPKDVTSKVYY